MDKKTTLKEIDELIKEGNEKVLSTKWDYSGTGIIAFGTYVNADIFGSWRRKVSSFLKLFLSEEHEYVKVFDNLTDNDYCNASICVQTLENVKQYIEKGFIDTVEETGFNVDDTLQRIFSRFYKVARQLRARYADKPTLEIEDEYDVQDLLHALLQLYFDDIRAEEWTPSYAGKCARVELVYNFNWQK